MSAQSLLQEAVDIAKNYNAAANAARGDNAVFDNADELKAAKKAADETIRALRSVKQRMSQEEKAVQASYQSAMAEAASKNHNALAFFGGRGAAGRQRAANKRAISQNKANALAPYRKAKLSVDDLIRQVTDVKGNLNAAISEMNAKSPEAPRASKSSAPNLTKQLAELADLHRAGALTEKEFADAKAKLLSA